jgi:hypothetical protein
VRRFSRESLEVEDERLKETHSAGVLCAPLMLLIGLFPQFLVANELLATRRVGGKCQKRGKTETFASQFLGYSYTPLS